MSDALRTAAEQLIDPQGRELAKAVRWLELDLPGLDPALRWPVAVLGEGQPVLLLHGFDSSLLEFRRLAPLLAGRYQLWIPDLFGFGFTPRPEGIGYNPAAVLQHLLAITEQMPEGPIGLIGASMGGSVAVVLARELQDAQPQRIEKLLLLAPAGLTGKPMPLPPLLDRLGAGFLGLPAVRRGLCRQAFADPDASVGPAEEEIASLHLSTPGWAAALACFARSGGFAGVGAPLPTAPIQVLWGAQDRILRAPQKRAAEALLGDRLHWWKAAAICPISINPSWWPAPGWPHERAGAGGDQPSHQALAQKRLQPAGAPRSQAARFPLATCCRATWPGPPFAPKGVVFQDLAIEQVELSSEPIDLDVGALLKGQPLQLRQSFAVKGWVQFSESGLTRCLQSPALADFSAELSRVLLGGQPLQLL